MEISTGRPESHPTPLPLDRTATPAVAPATTRFPSGTEQGGVLADTSGVDFTSEVAAAMAAGMAAERARRNHYEQTILPQGDSYGDAVDLPVVPSNAVPPAMSDLYPYPGLEPTPAAAGFEDPGYGT